MTPNTVVTYKRHGQRRRALLVRQQLGAWIARPVSPTDGKPYGAELITISEAEIVHE